MANARYVCTVVVLSDARVQHASTVLLVVPAVGTDSGTTIEITNGTLGTDVRRRHQLLQRLMLAVEALPADGARDENKGEDAADGMKAHFSRELF